MGGRFSRREVVPQAVGSRDNPYRYPPADEGNYFSSHYTFGHRKYENGEPEYFLFGEMNDINFLSSKPVGFPYKQPGKHNPLSCLQCHINVHRDSVRLVKSTESEDQYHMAFEFNSDVDCRISLLSSLPDSTELSSLRHGPGSGVQSSQHYLFPRGSEQSFNGRDFPLTPGQMREEELRYNPEEGQDLFPIAIFMETSSAAQYQSQLTLCALDKSSDGGYTVKVIRQKLWVDGVEYVLQEIYGLENKAKPKEEGNEGSGAQERENEEEEEEEDSDDEGEDLGAECVICITDARDTLLLPCRHLCLCAACAGNLRYQSNNCPICRTPFKALLQVTALKPLDPSQELDEDSVTGNPRYAISGFETMTLLEALNGYKLNFKSEDRADRQDRAAQAEEENEDEEGERAENGSTNLRIATDTVISVEEDPEIEALSQQAVATPTGSALPLKVDPKQEHVQIHLEDDVTLPGTVVLSDSEVTYRPAGSELHTPASDTVVTVIVTEEGRVTSGEGEGDEEKGSEAGETTTPESETSYGSIGSNSSTRSTDKLIKKL